MSETVEEKLAHFWHVGAGGAIVGATCDEIELAERRIGRALPGELRQVLRLSDGGVSKYDLFGDILVSPYRGVSKKCRFGDMAELHLRGVAEQLPSGAIIFAADASAWFALDYRCKPNSPQILHWSEYEEGPIVLAPSFRAFVDGLSRD